MKKPQNVTDIRRLADEAEGGSAFWLGFIKGYTAIDRATEP